MNINFKDVYYLNYSEFKYADTSEKKYYIDSFRISDDLKYLALFINTENVEIINLKTNKIIKSLIVNYPQEYDFLGNDKIVYWSENKQSLFCLNLDSLEENIIYLDDKYNNKYLEINIVNFLPKSNKDEITISLHLSNENGCSLIYKLDYDINIISIDTVDFYADLISKNGEYFLQKRSFYDKETNVHEDFIELFNKDNSIRKKIYNPEKRISIDFNSYNFIKNNFIIIAYDAVINDIHYGEGLYQEIYLFDITTDKIKKVISDITFGTENDFFYNMSIDERFLFISIGFINRIDGMNIYETENFTLVKQIDLFEKSKYKDFTLLKNTNHIVLRNSNEILIKEIIYTD